MLITILIMIGLIALLIFLNALYVAGEFAVVSARKTRISQMAAEGNRLASVALARYGRSSPPG